MEKKIVIKSTVGLHASLAAKVVQSASKFDVDIKLHYKDKVVDVKSILGLMSLAIPSGENVVLVASGDQALTAIEEIELSRLFDRFYRGDVSRNSATGGSGIGLSIVKKIMEDHGGKIWVTSKEGIGTVMYLVVRKYQEVPVNE